MNIIYLVLTILSLGFVAFGLILNSSKKPSQQNKPQKKKKGVIGGQFRAISHLNTKTEQQFFNQLCALLPDDYYIACKVRLADLCLPFDKKDFTSFNKVSKKHVDFTVIRKKTSQVQFAIELDDKSHQSKAARLRDDDKNYALSSANIPLFRIKPKLSYVPEIKKLVSQL
ncbi:DUF2726 domain-containing protein [Vibrio sp. SS-MA-C1-2]|uniref:DUF2726 domain-containing protein n=1 Tax=Vibrio sp. SS-MA-C1-2 TaxID=2908646 RepID=UPI001F28BFC4|nr:DUF2726 domain-containing protein [Vibrio sp. SS-MA-C1-2]UJF17247.1 DUF2726 domain-containing protein [Vibrio sp. SS-MA-C1-2]